MSNAATLGHWMNRCFNFEIPGTQIYSIGGAAGFGLPAAAGVKIAASDRQVVCLTGDGAFTMVERTLSNLMHDRIAIFTILWNNSAALRSPTAALSYGRRIRRRTIRVAASTFLLFG